MLLDIHYSSVEIFPGHLSSTMQTLSEFSLAGFWTSCRAVTADHSLSEFSMPLTVGCISCCSSATVLKWSRALLGTQSISKCWGECGPWAKSEDLIPDQPHSSALTLSAGVFALCKKLCVFVLGEKLNLWIPVLWRKLNFKNVFPWN